MGLSRRCVLKVTAVSLVAAHALPARAEYPDRLVKLLVPIPPGGAPDLVARLVARAMSESLRADYRGNSRVSAYQLMAIIAMVYLTTLLTLVPANGPRPNLAAGLAQVTSAGVIVMLQVLWVALFLYYGRSRVTGSVVSFHVVAERV